MSVAQIHEATTAQLFSSFVRSVQYGTQKISFPVLYVSLGGCDEDSQSQVPCANLHVSITLCCPFACLAGLADVNKRVTPFPTWTHSGHTTPHTSRVGTGGTGRTKYMFKTLGRNANQFLTLEMVPEFLETEPAPSPGAERTHWADSVLSRSLLIARCRTALHFSAASPLGSSSLVLSGVCKAGVVSPVALEHLTMMLRRKGSMMCPVWRISSFCMWCVHHHESRRQ